MSIPIINIEPLCRGHVSKSAVASRIGYACREYGFFYIEGHGIDTGLQSQLEQLSWSFFKQSTVKKNRISMTTGGRAWRGYFPLEGELTSGKPDLKEGLYFGEQLSPSHPEVKSGTPLHGANLFPDVPGFKKTVLDYMTVLSRLGRQLMQGIALSLELPAEFFETQFMVHPLTLFRIFHYPAPHTKNKHQVQWGVGEHTDYGVLTILKQDEVGGLQVYTKGRWTTAPYIENTFICNIGDMLDLMTGGYYRSTPHRVVNQSKRGRLSFPFFYDLDFNTKVKPLNLSHLGHGRAMTYQRWDQSDLHSYTGTYGTYLLEKISKVFPQLRDNLQ